MASAVVGGASCEKHGDAEHGCGHSDGSEEQGCPMPVLVDAFRCDGGLGCLARQGIHGGYPCVGVYAV